MTHKSNYVSYGNYIAEDVISDDVARDKLTAPPHSVLSAFWFYNIHKSLNVTASNDDFNRVTAVINGGFNGYNDRLAIFRKSVEILKGEHFNRLMLNEMFGFEDSSISQNRIYSFGWGLWHDPASSRAGTDKSRVEALKGYKKARELIMASPFKERELGRKAYGIEYRTLLAYINARIINLEGNNESVCLWIVFFIIQ